MSEEFKLEVVNPEKSFLSKEDVTEVVVPAFEGEMGILKDHISIISFLKPGIIKIYSKLGEEKYYVEDGIIEFKNNNLSILTSSIFNIKDMEKNRIDEISNRQADNNVALRNRRRAIDKQSELLDFDRNTYINSPSCFLNEYGIIIIIRNDIHLVCQQLKVVQN